MDLFPINVTLPARFYNAGVHFVAYVVVNLAFWFSLAFCVGLGIALAFKCT